MKKILDFLHSLQRNNNKEWFNENRDTYQSTRKQFMGVTEILIHELRQLDPEIPPLEAKDCVFRIFRDVRFSNDKRPYKTNYGCFIARGGRKSGFAGYYLHLEPGHSFIAGGAYNPPAAHLKAIRAEIFDDPHSYLSLINNPAFAEGLPDTYFDKLKTAPRGYPKEWEHMDLIRNRSYIWSCPLSDEILQSPNLFETIQTKFTLLKPMNHYLNQAMSPNNE